MKILLTHPVNKNEIGTEGRLIIDTNEFTQIGLKRVLKNRIKSLKSLHGEGKIKIEWYTDLGILSDKPIFITYSV